MVHQAAFPCESLLTGRTGPPHRNVLFLHVPFEAGLLHRPAKAVMP